ncbi:Sfi1 spindle body protein-domain-containing protein [Podospora aff. communis PSN243]|uniref:Sfi1 spindle body protein-domain-containing protein n=1 Tax=Podospora aff. communis PSN243 TaxID=3040156 RepID=A0AAV9H7K0_9PEZI|nr:Sfi1 spindle body protein-domain-containing protein [Podospora aff. communis PSN243]
MPPHSSLPLRDGRVGLPSSSSHISSSQNNDGDYSDDDIRLVAEIVRLGEVIYPNLPERDRLPTTALFQAAEHILPEHGYDADNAPSHIDRLIFKIGGQRSGETLSDKFKAVLAGMNIQVEYIPTSSPYEQSPAVRRAPSSRASAISGDTGSFDFDPRLAPRPGESSLSQPLGRFAPTTSPYELPLRPRPRPESSSPGDVFSSSGSAPLPEGGQSDFSDVQSPPVVRGFGKATVPKTPLDFGVKLPTVAPLRRSPGNNATGQFVRDENKKRGADFLAPAQPIQSLLPTMERILQPPRQLGAFGRDAGIAGLGDNKGLLESPLIIPNAHLYQPRTSGSGAHRGNHDDAFQLRDEQLLLAPPHDEPPAEDTQVLEAKLDQMTKIYETRLLHNLLFDWHTFSKWTRGYRTHHVSVATKFDDDDILAEVLDIWLEGAIVAQENRQKEQAAAEREEYIERMEKRAARVHEIVTMSTVLQHWHGSAREEAERTAVARRHLVRKRAFDGWRAQHVQDEAKVNNFVLMNALQRWSQVSLHHEVRQQVAARRYENDLAADTLDAMWKTQKRNAADEYWKFYAIHNCLDTWLTRTGESLAEEAVAGTLDERLLLNEVIDIWRDETEDLQYNGYNLTVEHLSRECQKTLTRWQEQARLERLLKHYNANKDSNLQSRALNVWRAASLEAVREKRMADILVMEAPFSLWKNETQLRVFQQKTEKEAKAGILRHWYCEERLTWYKRYSENRDKREILDYLHAFSQHARARRVRGEQDADHVLTYYRQSGAFDKWLAATDAMWKHHHNANLICLYRTAKPIVDVWREKRNQSVARDAIFGRLADRNARRGAVVTVLETWPGLAAEARRERMMINLRHFRRNYKVNLARSCLDNWWLRTADAIDDSNDAHALHVRHRRNEINGLLQHWEDTAVRALQIHQIAAEAELEVYCGMWQDHLNEARENHLDAADYDAEQMLGECWRKWEFELLQVDSKKRTAVAVRTRNDNRFCSQLLDDWHQLAAPDSTHTLQLSTMSRRSIRNLQAGRSTLAPDTTQQLEFVAPTPAPLVSILRQPPSTFRNPPSSLAPETPRLPVSQLGFARVGGSVRFARSIRDLGPMDEFDDDGSLLLPGMEPNDPGFMSTPTRRTGRERPLGYHPTTTPSTILPSPYERELRRGYGQSTQTRDFADITEESLVD